MANPPIVIGPFTSVPAPGSPIASAWPQQISTVVTDHAARVTSLEASATGAVTGKFRIWTFSGFVNPSASNGGWNIPIPGGTFSAVPQWMNVDDFYTAAGQPAQWTFYKIDLSNSTATLIAGQAVDFVTGVPRLGGSYSVRAFAYGPRP